MSTNVPLVSNIPASGKSAWATYITADEMMFSIALGGFEDVPDESNFTPRGVGVPMWKRIGKLLANSVNLKHPLDNTERS